jgi:hypothetical protein
MKLARLETCLQQFSDETRVQEYELELGFDAMLSDEAIKLVHASYRISRPLAKKVVPVKYNHLRCNGLDEHELAMA